MVITKQQGGLCNCSKNVLKPVSYTIAEFQRVGITFMFSVVYIKEIIK
jgi:hypothetical protein